MNRIAKALILLAVVSSAMLMGAVPLQESTLPSVPWWVWLLGFSVGLLLLFIMVIRLDWNSAKQQLRDEDQ